MEMNLVEDCPGLFSSGDPVEWAFANLEHLSSGTAAAIFQHPSRDDVVIRVSDYPDGWFMLADDIAQIHQEEDKPSPFLPVVHWLGYVDEVWIGAAEKLEEIEPGHPLEAVIEPISKALLKNDQSSWTEAELALQGFKEFSASLRNRLDVRESNFMRRNESLVFNDPYSQIIHAIEPHLREKYAVETVKPVCGPI